MKARQPAGPSTDSYSMMSYSDTVSSSSSHFTATTVSSARERLLWLIDLMEVGAGSVCVGRGRTGWPGGVTAPAPRVTRVCCSSLSLHRAAPAPSPWCCKAQLEPDPRTPRGWGFWREQQSWRLADPTLPSLPCLRCSTPAKNHRAQNGLG
uniref:Whirlin n=1 Tax=Cyanistes caeruleus TaxID=156563 RepID=A0A8C0VTC1_CYACU